jgi:hypothetical protein
MILPLAAATHGKTPFLQKQKNGSRNIGKAACFLTTIKKIKYLNK